MKTVNIKDIRPFDIMLEGSTNKLSEMIQSVINEDISHTGVFFEVIGPRGRVTYVHESKKFGIINTNFRKFYLKSKYTVYIARLKGVMPTVQRDDKLMQFAIESAGHAGYDFMNLLIHQPIKFLWKKLTGKTIWLGRKNKKAEGRFICSERTAFIMNKFFCNEPKWWEISTDHFMNNAQYEIFKLKI